jgi:hypothetical protein
MRVGELLGLAEAVLTLTDEGSRIAAVEKYADAFAEWYQAGEGPDGPGACGRAELEGLAERHAQVVACVQALLAETAADMGGFHKKARGIMAYTDLLPKRISVAKLRKG